LRGRTAEGQGRGVRLPKTRREGVQGSTAGGGLRRGMVALLCSCTTPTVLPRDVRIGAAYRLRTACAAEPSLAGESTAASKHSSVAVSCTSRSCPVSTTCPATPLPTADARCNAMSAKGRSAGARTREVGRFGGESSGLVGPGWLDARRARRGRTLLEKCACDCARCSMAPSTAHTHTHTHTLTHTHT
jgi:hypothetical protein